MLSPLRSDTARPRVTDFYGLNAEEEKISIHTVSAFTSLWDMASVATYLRH